jgi:MFS family permease
MPTAQQSPRFLLLYALAWAGGSVAYVPFLTILLPVHVTALAGHGADVVWLAYIAFFGAIAASVGYICFGFLSDVTRNRRAWIWLGLALSCGLLLTASRATDLLHLVLLVLGWQLALNMMLAPLSAWAADCVPNDQKGLLGGLLAFAPGIGALAGAFVTIPGMASSTERLALVALVVAACVLPVLTLRAPVPVAASAPDPGAADGTQALDQQGAALRMWLARLLVQVAEAALFSFLYLWFRSIDPAMSDHRTARIFGLVLVLSAPVALLAGRWADRFRRPLAPLIACALVAPVGLIGMALARTLPQAIAAYAVFGFATSIFLALHSAQTLRTLPNPHRRGRDLGLFNLTNTMPSLVMPWFTLALVPISGFSGLFLLFAGLSVMAALLLASFGRGLAGKTDAPG